MKNFFLIIIALFLFTNIYSQNVVVKGKVVDEDGEPIAGVIIRVKDDRNATMSDIEGKYTLKDVPPDKINIIFSFTGKKEQYFKIPSRNLIYNNDTLILNTVLECEEIILSNVIVRKPIIYLYSEKEILVDIKLNFLGNIQNTYPEYDNGWQVIVKPSGEIINKKDNSVHRYLFWDGLMTNEPQISDFKTGFVVKGSQTVNFLDSVLNVVGLNQLEKNDFITFWMPYLKNNEYNFVHFLINDDCNNVASLNITPKPDSEIRIYMIFSAIAEPFAINPQNLKSNPRKGFTLVEWGGIEMNKLKIE